jgi:hypothetical protein
MYNSSLAGLPQYVDPYDVDTLNPQEERVVNELWNAVPGGGQEVKAKAAVLKKYRKGYEGIFQGLSYCLKYGEKDDQAPRIALFPLFLASPALDHGVDSKVRHPEWVEFIRSVKSNRGTAVRQRCCCCCQLVIPLGLIS